MFLLLKCEPELMKTCLMPSTCDTSSKNTPADHLAQSGQLLHCLHSIICLVSLSEFGDQDPLYSVSLVRSIVVGFKKLSSLCFKCQVSTQL